MPSKFDPVSAGADSNLTIQGSNIEAGHAVQLLADNQVKLLAAQNTASEKSTDCNRSGSIGISYGKLRRNSIRATQQAAPFNEKSSTIS